MHPKTTDVSFSDRELVVISRVALERGITVEEAANELIHEGIAQRFKQRLGRQPATVYPIKSRSKS
jgi:hypothetical protein